MPSIGGGFCLITRVRFFVFSLLLLGLLLLLNVQLGSTQVSLVDLGGFFDAENRTRSLPNLAILALRFERALIACFCGFCLAGAGVVSQGLFRNDLASPSVLGATAGASLGVLICVLFFWDLSLSQFWLLPTSSILGCLLALGGVLLLARRMRIVSMDDLLLVGFSWNALLGSIQILLTSLAFDDWQRVPALSAWLFGGLGGRTLPDLLIGLARPS